MKTIYVVEGSAGGWSGFSWLVAAYEDQEAAELHAREATDGKRPDPKRKPNVLPSYLVVPVQLNPLPQ
jgi:hypothetical protein